MDLSKQTIFHKINKNCDFNHFGSYLLEVIVEANNF